MYSSPAIDYLIRKKTIRKQKFVIQTKIIFASWLTVAVYLLFKYFGNVLMQIEPIVYGGAATLAFGIYIIIGEHKTNSGGSK